MKIALSLPLLFALLTARPAWAPAGDEWAPGIPYTTDWKKAIKSASESGRMLFIYNGWQREGI
jgi:hypothetical protein